MKVFLHTSSALFTVCQYLARCSRYVLPKFGPIGRNTRYPYTFLFKKSCSKWALKQRFLPNFSDFDRFFCVFSCIPMSYTRLQWKNLWKMLRRHFMTRFMPKNGQNIGKFPYFHKKSRYLKNTFLDTSLARKVLLSSNLDQLLLGAWEKTQGAFFENSHFSGWFADF